MDFIAMSLMLSIIFLVALFIYMPGTGKFWHKHDWYEYIRVEAPSIYSRRKTNHHTAWKCSSCSAFRVDTITIKESSERV